MSLASSTPIAGRARVTILVIIATLFLVPALVRATFSTSPTSPVRLNRGFERPPAKCHVTPPPVVMVKALLRGEAEPPKIDRLVLVLDGPGPDAPPVGSPDAFRGPPILALA
jgi:hypothetical protein